MSTARRIAQLEAKRARARGARVFVFTTWPGKDTAGDDAARRLAEEAAKLEGLRLTVVRVIDPNRGLEGGEA